MGAATILSALLTITCGVLTTHAENLRNHVGVFLRCTGEEDPLRALEAVRSLGLNRIQVSKLPDRFYSREGATEFSGMLKSTGVKADAVVVVFDGESYKDQEAVRRTVGFRPLAMQKERLAYARRCVDFAAGIGSRIVTLHMGFLPKDPKDPLYQGMLRAVREIAEYAEGRGVTISLETGQETGEELSHFLDLITTARVGVNFDIANLILYGIDSSPQALHRLLGRVTSVHVKDGLRPQDPRLIGREVRLGEGNARVGECLQFLRDSDFQGALIIENYVARELGTKPLDELRRARDFIYANLGSRRN
jgi:L-ribulose-5-phosphate 3-epimerase